MKPEELMASIEEDAVERSLPIIGPRRGQILDEVMEEHNPSAIVEVGTLVGYSAIRMGRHLKAGQKITCVEVRDDMARVARANFERVGLSDHIEVVVGDALKVLPTLRGPIDMMFLDARKTDYISYLKSVEHLMHRGSVVVADNVKSHAGEVASYLDYVRNSGKYRSRYWESEGDYRYGTRRAENDGVEISVMT